MIYTDKVMDHFQNPRNVGVIKDADGVGQVGNPVCGDMMTFYIKVADGRLADIKSEAGVRNVALAFHRNQEAAARVLADRTLVARVDDYGASAEVELAPGAASDSLLQALMGAGVGILRFEVVEPSLQSIFIARVGMDAATAPAREDLARA